MEKRVKKNIFKEIFNLFKNRWSQNIIRSQTAVKIFVRDVFFFLGCYFDNGYVGKQPVAW